MKKGIQIIAIIILFIGCKTNTPTPKAIESSETSESSNPTFAYKQQKENMEKGIYFRGTGTEPDWSSKISEKTIEFTSLKPGYEAISANHVDPIFAMDANVKMYRVETKVGKMIIQIMQQECVNQMSGDKSNYSVRIEFQKDDKSIHLSGCGNYVTDYRLQDIWVLEELNGEKVSVADFSKELPNMEINTANNTFMGFAGCNRMNGSVFFEKGLLRFTKVITTRMACGGDNKESLFLKTLQSTTTYKIENLRLKLSNPSGTEIVFKKVD
jgi:heat shock protein HslJ